MPTPSSGAGSSAARRPARDLRDSWVFRLAALLVVLLAAFAVSRSCASAGRNVSSDDAVAIARNSASFDPDKVQVRFVQQGIPPRPLWAVSLYNLDDEGRPSRVQVVLVDASTGEILRR